VFIVLSILSRLFDQSGWRKDGWNRLPVL